VNTQVIYNGNIFLEIEMGQIATILCADRRVSSDIEIIFAEDGTVEYEGNIIEANLGQTVVLKCAGQKMKSDVVIHTQDTMYQTLITVDGHMYTTSEDFIFKVLES